MIQIMRMNYVNTYQISSLRNVFSFLFLQLNV